jgi:ribosomal protein S27AE
MPDPNDVATSRRPACGRCGRLAVVLEHEYDDTPVWLCGNCWCVFLRFRDAPYRLRQGAAA